MNPDHLATASPLGLLLFVLWIGLSWIAVWKWKNPIYRLPPFIIATAVPVMFGWQNLTVGAITMNIGTAFVLLAYRIDEIWPFKKPY